MDFTAMRSAHEAEELPSALDFTAMRKQAEGQEKFDAQEAAKSSVVERKGGEVVRGLFRGGENIMTGVADLVGADDFAENYESKVPYSSGSKTEKVSEYFTPIPQVAKLPGALAKLGGKVAPPVANWLSKSLGKVGGGAANAATQGAVYGTVLSDGETAVEKVKDAALGAVSGAAVGGAVAAGAKGLFAASKEGKALVKSIAEKRGAERVSGELTFGKKIGDSPDILSKLGVKATRAINKGPMARATQRRDQLTHDDIYLMKLDEVFDGVPEAQAAAKKVFGETRSPKKAFDAGQPFAYKYYNNARPNMSAKANQEAYAASSAAEAVEADKVGKRLISAMDARNKTNRVNLNAELKAERKAAVAAKEVPGQGPKYAEYVAKQRARYNEQSRLWTDEISDLRVDTASKQSLLKKSHAAELKRMRDSAPKLRPVEPDGRRDLHKRVVSTRTRSPDAISGRYSADSARRAGDVDLADSMQPTKTWGYTPGKEGSPEVSVGQAIGAAGTEMATVVAAVAGGRPDLAAALVITDLTRRGVRGAYRKGRKAQYKSLRKHPFEPNLERATKYPLPEDGTVKKLLLGDTKAQQKYQEFMQNDDMKGLENYLTQFFARAETEDAS